MMKATLSLALVASASAFAPPSQRQQHASSITRSSSSSALSAKPFADEIGAQVPVSSV